MAAPARQRPVQVTVPTPHGATGTLHFQTAIGSFKTISSFGKIVMDFKGSVMLSSYKASTPGMFGTSVQGQDLPKIEGDVKLQFEGHNRLVYFGSGRLTIDGAWRAIQWFGRDLKATWTGAGMIRLVGEFDKDLNTGTFTYDDPKAIHYWPTSVTPTQLPEPKSSANIQPMERTGSQ
jgi:hypothetical protein